MTKLAKSASGLIVWIAVFLAYGYIYETSYFATLGLSAMSTLSVRHFIYSGFRTILPPLIALSAMGLLIKFFSRRIESNDLDALVKSAKEVGFTRSLSMARLVFLFCAAVWLFAIFEHFLFEVPRAWAAVPWLLLFVLQAFTFAMYTSPPEARVALIFAFAIAIGLCLSSWAMGSARFAESLVVGSGMYVRDDAVVRITRTNSGYTAESKPIKLPLPILEKLLAVFITRWQISSQHLGS
jgi:hypothetical protein